MVTFLDVSSFDDQILYLPIWASKFEHFDILLARHGILLAPGKRASASVEPWIKIKLNVVQYYNDHKHCSDHNTDTFKYILLAASHLQLLIKGSITHLQALQISMTLFLQVASDIR